MVCGPVWLRGVSAWGIHVSFKVTFFSSESCFQQMICLSLFLSGRCWKGESLGLAHSYYSYSLSAVLLSPHVFLFLQERTVRSISYSMLHLHPQDYLLYLIFFSPLLLQFTFIFKGALTNPNGQICWRFQNFYANFRESFVEWPIKSVVLDSVFKVIYDNGNDSSFLINR